MALTILYLVTATFWFLALESGSTSSQFILFFPLDFSSSTEAYETSQSIRLNKDAKRRFSSVSLPRQLFYFKSFLMSPDHG